ADEHGAVDLGSEYGRPEDADDVEPRPAEPDSLAGVDAVDPESLRGRGAQHRDRQPRGRGVQVAAALDRGADRCREAETGGDDGKSARVDRWDQRAAIDV